jgi:hypothetical protein
MTRIIVPFVSEAYRYTVPGKRPQILEEPILQLLRPVARKERNDFGSSIFNDHIPLFMRACIAARSSMRRLPRRFQCRNRQAQV